MHISDFFYNFAGKIYIVIKYKGMEKTDNMASVMENAAAQEPQQTPAKGRTRTGIKRRKWHREEERIMLAMFNANESYEAIGEKINRTISAVTSRLQRMGYLMYDKEKKEVVRIK